MLEAGASVLLLGSFSRDFSNDYIDLGGLIKVAETDTVAEALSRLLV